jgi:hypothetical protein
MAVLYPGGTDRERMEHFSKAHGMPAVRNAELVKLELEVKGWRLRPLIRNQGFGTEPSL